MCARAAEHGREMVWPAVASRYLESFDRAHTDHARRRHTRFRAATLANRPAVLPDVDLGHLAALTDPTGILQHAAFDVPRYDDGYCLDDNARALLAVALVEDVGAADPKAVRALGTRYLAFVQHAFNPERGRFRNFMSYSRRWLEEQGSEDSHGRALWALGSVVTRSTDHGRRGLAGDLFHAALPVVDRFTSPRAWAYSLLGIDEYLKAFHGDRNVQDLRKTLADRLVDVYERTAGPGWPWFENKATYGNARLSQALLVSGAGMENESMIAIGLRSLDWLAEVQAGPDGYFAPIGSNGFYPRGGVKATLDEQPIEASSMVSASLVAARITKNPRWKAHADRAFLWFLGDNRLQQPLYDPATGGCRDGLHAERVNENQGAESTLSFLLALLEMRLSKEATS
jgi:hypothetical protein